jgi:ABC-type phosphate transport system substrate-binding protein
MKIYRYIFLTLAMVAVIAVFAVAAGSVKIVANPGIKASSISAEQLKGIFLQESTSFDGSNVEPVLEKSGATHEAFLKDYLGKTDAVLQTYYRSMVFSGKGSMPKVFASDAEVISYVTKTKGAIGYVSPSASAEGVKVLEVK